MRKMFIAGAVLALAFFGIPAASASAGDVTACSVSAATVTPTVDAPATVTITFVGTPNGYGNMGYYYKVGYNNLDGTSYLSDFDLGIHTVPAGTSTNPDGSVASNEIRTEEFNPYLASKDVFIYNMGYTLLCTYRVNYGSGTVGGAKNFGHSDKTAEPGERSREAVSGVSPAGSKK